MRMFTTVEAADQLHLSTRTLERHRISGTGPVFVKLGHSVRYLKSDLEDWVQEQRFKSTSEENATRKGK